jgi:hypothetical protein
VVSRTSELTLSVRLSPRSGCEICTSSCSKAAMGGSTIATRCRSPVWSTAWRRRSVGAAAWSAPQRVGTARGDRMGWGVWLWRRAHLHIR